GLPAGETRTFFGVCVQAARDDVATTESPYFHLTGGNQPNQPSSWSMAGGDGVANTPCVVFAPEWTRDLPDRNFELKKARGANFKIGLLQRAFPSQPPFLIKSCADN